LAAVVVVEETVAQPMLLIQLAARVVFMAAVAAAAEELYSQVEVFIAQVLTAQVAQSVSSGAMAAHSLQLTQEMSDVSHCT
jgi:hypothetical protein